MAPSEQRRFIRQLIGNVKKDLIAKVPKIPREWDGIELRQWIADAFTDATCGYSKRKELTWKRRFRAYRNEVLVRNL